MPDLTISTGGGDATIGGDVSGRDKTTRVSDDETRQDLRDLAALIGKLQSDMVSVRLQVAVLTTELGAAKERQLYGNLANAAYTTILGAIVLIVALLLR